MPLSNNYGRPRLLYGMPRMVGGPPTMDYMLERRNAYIDALRAMGPAAAGAYAPYATATGWNLGPQAAAYGAPAPQQQPANPYAEAYEAAKRANEARYSDILSRYGQREQDVMGQLSGVGAQAASDIAAMGRSAMGEADQGTISRGLYGSTERFGLRQAAANQGAARLARLYEGLGQQRAGTLAGLRGDTLGFMERREDVYPDMGNYLSLMQQYGQYGQPGIGAPIRRTQPRTARVPGRQAVSAARLAGMLRRYRR